MILNSVNDLKKAPARIVSLVPSQTELLHFLGLEKKTIAITKFCVHPSGWLTEKQIIGGTKNINIPKVKSLQPHLIIANKEENVKEQVEELAKGCPVWVTDVNDLSSALHMIQDIGKLTKTIFNAKKLVEKIKDHFSNFAPKANQIRVAYFIWQNPYITIGGDTFINDMLKRCGLHNIFGNKIRYPIVTIKDLKEADLQVLLLSSEPYPFKQQHIKALQELLPNTKILLADGEMFSWYGSRLLRAPEYFNKLLSEIYAALK